MAKRFTPVIGLAVVVALALAAVFGAMSLTNPAFAAVGAPADAELAERTSSPQGGPVATLEIAEDESKWFDITEHIPGYHTDDLQDALIPRFWWKARLWWKARMMRSR